MVGLCHCNYVLLTPVRLVHQDPQALFCNIAFCLVSVQPDYCIELFCPRYRTSCQSFLNFTVFPLVRCSSLSRPLEWWPYPPHFSCSPQCNVVHELLRVHFIVQIVDEGIGLTINPLGASHITNCQLDHSTIVYYLLSPTVLPVFHLFL